MQDNLRIPTYSEEPDRLGSGALVIVVVVLFWLLFGTALWWLL